MKTGLILSVIIPVYNANTITTNELISSINKNIVKKDIEYIFVENGTKSSFEMDLKNKIDKKIIYKYCYIRTANVSMARNIGIEMANGIYIAFIDYDDTINENWSREILGNIKNTNSDLYYFNFTITKKKTTEEVKFPQYKTKKDLVISILSYTDLRGYLWNKVFKKEIVINNKIHFDDSISFCEDLLFVVFFIKFVKTYTLINFTLYNYFITENSLTTNNNPSKIIDAIFVRKKIINLVNKDELYYSKLMFLKAYCHFFSSKNKIDNALNLEYYSYFKKIKKEIKTTSLKIFILKHPLLYKALVKTFK